jgi:hypothetical protein
MEENNLQKLKRDYPEFFKECPPKLIELANSEKTASQVAEMCLKNDVDDEKDIENVAYHIASVLLGSLPPEILPKALTINVKIDAETAKKISEEANQLIFSQVRDDLDKIHPPAKPKGMTEEKPTKSIKKPDTYREPVE